MTGGKFDIECGRRLLLSSCCISLSEKEFSSSVSLRLKDMGALWLNIHITQYPIFTPILIRSNMSIYLSENFRRRWLGVDSRGVPGN